VGFVFVGAGAFFGACARYGLSKLSTLVFGSAFPLGTLLSNVIAGILIGFIITSSGARWHLAENHKLFLTVGLLGGLSTMSAFSMETVQMFGGGQTWLAIANMVLNLSLSIGGVLLGMWIANMVYAK
jgi:fluoride exporter